MPSFSFISRKRALEIKQLVFGHSVYRLSQHLKPCRFNFRTLVQWAGMGPRRSSWWSSSWEAGPYPTESGCASKPEESDWLLGLEVNVLCSEAFPFTRGKKRIGLSPSSEWSSGFSILTPWFRLNAVLHEVLGSILRPALFSSSPDCT